MELQRVRHDWAADNKKSIYWVITILPTLFLLVPSPMLWVGSVIHSITQMKTWGLREVLYFAQAHTPIKCQSWHSNLDLTTKSWPWSDYLLLLSKSFPNLVAHNNAIILLSLMVYVGWEFGGAWMGGLAHGSSPVARARTPVVGDNWALYSLSSPPLSKGSRSKWTQGQIRME